MRSIITKGGGLYGPVPGTSWSEYYQRKRKLIYNELARLEVELSERLDEIKAFEQATKEGKKEHD